LHDEQHQTCPTILVPFSVFPSSKHQDWQLVDLPKCHHTLSNGVSSPLAVSPPTLPRSGSGPFIHLPFKLTVQDLMVDPSTRDASDVSHKITAVGSRSTESAQKFIDKLKAFGDDKNHPSSWGVGHGVLEGVKAYATYEEVFADKVSQLLHRLTGRIVRAPTADTTRMSTRCISARPIPSTTSPQKTP
jgi:hypothetical protein